MIMREDLFGQSAVVTLPFIRFESGALASQAKCFYCGCSSSLLLLAGECDGGFKGCDHAGHPLLVEGKDDEPAAIFTFFRELPGVHQGTVSAWERGADRPSAGHGERLLRIAKREGVIR